MKNAQCSAVTGRTAIWSLPVFAAFGTLNSVSMNGVGAERPCDSAVNGRMPGSAIVNRSESKALPTTRRTDV